MFGPAGDDHLGALVGEPIISLKLGNHRILQFVGTAHGGVLGKSPFDGPDGSHLDVLRRIEIGFPCAEPDDVPSCGFQGIGFGLYGQRRRWLDERYSCG